MKLLILLPRVPYPLEKGDKLRAFYQLKELSKYHEIYLIALNRGVLHPEAKAKVMPFCKRIDFLDLPIIRQAFGVVRAFLLGLPLQCGFFYSSKIKRKIREIIDEVKPDHIYCQMIRVAEYVKLLPISKTIDYQDVLSKGMQRRSEKASPLLKPFFQMEYRRLKRYEAEIFSYFDHKTIITGVDREFIDHPNNYEIEIIANGVDFEKYQSSQNEKVYDLIFSGNMAYPPNIYAADYLARQIFPLLKQEFPDLKLAIVGANPVARVQALANDAITVTGWVDSMPEYYAKSKVFIAPMTLGTGLQNKLIEAMAMQLPCVTSSLAGKPLAGVENGKDIIICETLTGYVDAVSLLLSNKEQYSKIAENGHQFVKKNYNWEVVCKQLNDVICS